MTKSIENGASTHWIQSAIIRFSLFTISYQLESIQAFNGCNVVTFGHIFFRKIPSKYFLLIVIFTGLRTIFCIWLGSGFSYGDIETMLVITFSRNLGKKTFRKCCHRDHISPNYITPFPLQQPCKCHVVKSMAAICVNSQLSRWIMISIIWTVSVIWVDLHSRLRWTWAAIPVS